MKATWTMSDDLLKKTSFIKIRSSGVSLCTHYILIAGAMQHRMSDGSRLALI